MTATLTQFDLYRVPVLGGTPKVLVRDIDSDFAFSPDGHRIAFARANDPDIGKYRLVTATAEGNDDKLLCWWPQRPDCRATWRGLRQPTSSPGRYFSPATILAESTWLI